jgi:HPt (histidine-containing phosphotransfer) domain-containing protein
MFKGQYIDLQYLHQICEGDKLFMTDMIDTFLNDAPGILAKMKGHVKAGEWKQLGDLAHSFKTSLIFMGIQSLYDTIKSVEFSGRQNQDTGSLPHQVDTINTICEAAIRELSSFRESIK